MRRYFRLVIDAMHELSHQKAGIFVAAGDLCDEGRVAEGERLALDDLLRWFNRELPVPTGMIPKAICWFRGERNPVTRRIWELA